jgi:hypothetical protein
MAEKEADSQAPVIHIQVKPFIVRATPQSVAGALKKFTPQPLEDVGAVVSDVQSWLFAKLGEINPWPNAISLEFGIAA